MATTSRKTNGGPRRKPARWYHRAFGALLRALAQRGAAFWTILGAVLTAIAVNVFSSYFPISESKLVFVTTDRMQAVDSRWIGCAKHSKYSGVITFQNRGLRTGFISDLVLSPIRLNDEDVLIELAFIDRKPIAWLRREEVAYELVVRDSIHMRRELGSLFRVNAVYLDDEGRAVHYQTKTFGTMPSFAPEDTTAIVEWLMQFPEADLSLYADRGQPVTRSDSEHDISEEGSLHQFDHAIARRDSCLSLGIP